MEIRALLASMWRSKTGPLLVAAQVALALAVLVNVAYVIGMRLEAIQRPTGLDLANMFWVSTQSTADQPDAAAYATALKADLAWLNALPGVQAAATVMPLPQTFSNFGMVFFTEPPSPKTKPHLAGIYLGSERALESMGLELIAGRKFSPEAIQPPPASFGELFGGHASEVIITDAMARALFPEGHALGRTIYMGSAPVKIIGIVRLLRSNPMPAYQDARASQLVLIPGFGPGPNGQYVVRTAPGRRAEIMAKVDRELGPLQPNRFVSRVEAYDQTADRVRAGPRATIGVLSVVGALVLCVTLVGIVGLASFHVASRTRQLGTRRALGASAFHILRYFLVESWITTTIGVVLGSLLALLAGVELSRIYQTPRLPLYYLAGGVLLLWMAGLIAVLLPARKAARVSPAVATRAL